MSALPPPARGETPAPSLLRNILFHLSSRSILVFLALLSTPILLHRLGTGPYGIYVLAVTLADLMAILGVALIPAGVMLLSGAVHDRDWPRCQRIVSTAFALYLALGAVVGVSLALLVPWLVADVLHVADDLQPTARLALWLTTLTFLLTISAAIFNAIAIALERYDRLTPRLVSVSLVAATLTISYALLGGGVVGLLAINALAAAASLLLLYLLSRSLLPTIHYRPGFDPQILRQLGQFGALKFLGSLSGGVVFRVDQVIISTVLGVQTLAIYAVPATICLRAASLVTELVTPVFPRVGKLREDLVERRRLFLRVTRLVMVGGAPVLVLLAILGDQVLRLWIRGPEGELIAREGVAVMRWLMAAFLIQVCSGVATIYCEGLGKPHIPNLTATVTAATWVPVAILLTRSYGIVGPPMALCVVTLVFNIPFIFYASQTQASVRPVELISHVLARPLLAVLVTIGAGLVVHPYVHDVPSLVLGGLALAAVYGLSAFALGALQPADFVALAALLDRWPARWPGRAWVVKWGRRLAGQADS